jgi:hypothetical protein
LDEGLGMTAFFHAVFVVFVVLALLIWTVSAFTMTWPKTLPWLWWGAGCAAVAGMAELLLLAMR